MTADTLLTHSLPRSMHSNAAKVCEFTLHPPWSEWKEKQVLLVVYVTNEFRPIEINLFHLKMKLWILQKNIGISLKVFNVIFHRASINSSMIF